MANVAGIGGVFIDSEDATRLAEWYQEVLGIDMETHPDGIGYFKVFQTRDLHGSFVRENPVFAINQVEGPLARTGRGFTLNLRVDDLEAMLGKLREHGVFIEDRILEWAGGRHAWIQDLDGNRVELYQELFGEEPDG